MNKVEVIREKSMGIIGWLSVMLTTLFVGLKLTEYIDWNWLMVFSPVLIVPAILLALLVVVLLGIAIVTVIGFIRGKI